MIPESWWESVYFSQGGFVERTVQGEAGKDGHALNRPCLLLNTATEYHVSLAGHLSYTPRLWGYTLRCPFSGGENVPFTPQGCLNCSPGCPFFSSTDFDGEPTRIMFRYPGSGLVSWYITTFPIKE